MTTEELQAEADRIAALRNDPRTAAIVRRAFLRPGAVTLRRYLALEEVGSPVLTGQWPWDDAEAMGVEFCQAWEIIFPARELPPAGDLAGAMGELSDEVARAFSTVMPMRFPRTAGAEPMQTSHDGLGWLARFLARFSYPPDQTLDMPLDQLFIISAAMAANDGADSVGEDYKERLIHGVSKEQQPCDEEAENDQ